MHLTTSTRSAIAALVTAGALIIPATASAAHLSKTQARSNAKFLVETPSVALARFADSPSVATAIGRIEPSRLCDRINSRIVYCEASYTGWDALGHIVAQTHDTIRVKRTALRMYVGITLRRHNAS